MTNVIKQKTQKKDAFKTIVVWKTNIDITLNATRKSQIILFNVFQNVSNRWRQLPMSFSSLFEGRHITPPGVLLYETLKIKRLLSLFAGKFPQGSLAGE